MGEVEQKNNDTSLPTAKIIGLEVFASGTHNGDSYSDNDLDAMVAAFDKVGFQPTVKAGHADGQENEKEARRVFGAPALGYVERIYREGHKLLADFKDIPRRFAELIKAGAYKRVSAEIYWQYAKGETKYPRVLKAVAFLGAEIPALTNLKAIESLYQKNEAGLLFAYDDDNNEFRAYEQDYCGMEMGGMGGRKLDKQTVNYSEDGGSTDESCGNCRYYQGSQCSVVEGTVDYSGICDLQKTRPDMQSKMADDQEVRKYHIVKRGDKWCVTNQDKTKTLGCHSSEAEAMNQLKAVEANKNHSENAEVDMPGMTEEQVNALLKEREESMFKQFEDRIHQAREEGKADANKENELLREDIRKLQLEKRSERIEHWIKGMKEKGKLLPAEESKVRTLRQWLPDEGEGLKYFAVKDGQTKEFSAGPADIFESLFENRQSLFTNYSHADPLNEDDGNELQDPSAEVDRRAKQYQERMAKENKTVSYKDALGYVLKNNAGLAQRYQDRSRPN